MPFWPSDCVVSHVSCHSRFFQFQNSNFDLSMSRTSTSYSAGSSSGGSFDGRRCSRADPVGLARVSRGLVREVRDHGLLGLVGVGPQHAVAERREPDLGEPRCRTCATNIVRGCVAFVVLVRDRYAASKSATMRPSAIRSSWLRSSILARTCAALSEVFEIVRHASVIIITMIALAIMTSMSVRPACARASSRPRSAATGRDAGLRGRRSAADRRCRRPSPSHCRCPSRPLGSSSCEPMPEQHLVHRGGVGEERDDLQLALAAEHLPLHGQRDLADRRPSGSPGPSSTGSG